MLNGTLCMNRRPARRAGIVAAMLCFASILALSGGAFALSTTLPGYQLVTEFPDGWTVVTPETAARYAALLGVSSDVAADVMRSDGVVIAAFGTGADIAMRVRMEETSRSAVYFDIDRYTTAMRNAIRADYLDVDAWRLTGLRFSEAEWKNPAKSGRYLRLTYTRRSDGETVARGLMAYTVRNGREVTLQLEATGRQLTPKEVKMFDDWVAATSFEPRLEMPMLPTELNFDEPFPFESNSLTVRIKGSTAPGATVTGSVIQGTDAPFKVGEAEAKSSGAFTLTLTLPREGTWTLLIESELEGYETTRFETTLVANVSRIPVNLNAPLEGEIWDAQPRLAGKTLAGTEITVSDNGNISKRTTSDGEFSIKLDPDPAGTRVVTVTLKKKGYDERAIKYVFERRWHTEDYEEYLKTQVKSLSYANLIADPDKYTGRVVKWSGEAVEIAVADGSSTVRMATSPGKADPEELYCISDQELQLDAGSAVAMYGEMTGEVYSIPGDETIAPASLPIMKILMIITE
ncbi:MAG: hypothetical protein LBB86_08935 [Oscillospiraceae bacterium]|jgi:hypothetical protein|nr:hypothetical protein [Oscillospiraceae bacterium]